MDRTVITRHLLNVGTDPFNRQPLSAEDLLPNEDLKKRIEQWREKGTRNVKAKLVHDREPSSSSSSSS